MIKEYYNGNNSVLVDQGFQSFAYFDSEIKIVRARQNEISNTNVEHIALWGEGNDFPQQIDKELENADLAKALDFQARMLMNGGLAFKFIDPIDDTPIDKANVDRKTILEIRSFLKNSWYYPIHAAKNFYKLINVFAQLQLQADRKKITGLYCREANWCRLGLQNNDGDIEKVYINSNWPDARFDDKETIDLPYLDSVYDSPYRIKEEDYTEYGMHLYYPTGKSYYQLGEWNGIRKSWLPLLNKIPDFKVAVMENQITVKYHIQFPDYYWKDKFGDEYDSWPEKKKSKKRKEEFKRINDFLKGIENAGKSIGTTYRTELVNGKEFPGVKITEIGDKLRKEGIYLEDTTDATIKLYSALGFDPTIFGINSGNAQNRGGTDKREAWNIHVQTLTPHAEIILKPYEFISEYNGWNTDEYEVKWYFNNAYMQTLDKVSLSERQTKTPDKDAD